MSRLDEGVSAASFFGEMSDEAAPWCAENLDWLLAATGPRGMSHFLDLSQLARPSSKVRNVYISKLIELRAQVSGIHCHYDASSTINALMVTAANVVLSGAVTIHKTRDEFERAMRHSSPTDRRPRSPSTRAPVQVRRATATVPGAPRTR